MVAARSAAMGFNRLADASHDALNPRTAMRELPRGAMTRARSRGCSSPSRRPCSWSRRGSSARCASCSRRSRSRSCSGIRWRSASRATRSCFSGSRWRSRRSAAGSPRAGAAASEPWLLGAGDRHLGRRLRRPLCLPGSRVRSRARPALDSGALRRRALAADLARRCTSSTVAVPRRARPRSRISGRSYLAGVAGVAVLLVYEQSLVSEHDLSQVKRAFDLNG